MEKAEHLCTAGGTVNWTNHEGKQNEVSSEELKIELSYDLTIQTWVFTWENKGTKGICEPYVHWSIIYNKYDKKTVQVSGDEWIKKMYYKGQRDGSADIHVS